MSEGLDEISCSFLVYSSLLLNDLLCLQLLLKLAFESPFNVDARPPDALSVCICSLTMHHIFVPRTLVATAIWVLYAALAFLATVRPLTLIDGSRGVAVSAVTVHEIIFPIPFILFRAEIVTS